MSTSPSVRLQWILVASLCWLLPVLGFGLTQTTGRINGTVKDAQGAVIVGAEVSVENPATGDRRSALTDSSGTYSIVQLPPATYVVKIHAHGFSSAVFQMLWCS
jgi:Carboxypeptidase regulatory-like domain